MSTPNRILGLTVAAAVLFAPCLAFAQVAGSDQPPNAASASPPDTAAAPSASPAPPVAAATPATTAPPSQAPGPPDATTASPAVTTQPQISVALVIAPELKAIVWSHSPELLRPMYELGDVNNIGQATGNALEDLLKTMSFDVHVVASSDEAQKVSGASYFLVPTIQRYEEHNQGITTFAPFVETIVVQWKVTDTKGNTVLLDTVLASATGRLGNNFIAASRALTIENEMLADLKTKSTALLKPVLVGP